MAAAGYPAIAVEAPGVARCELAEDNRPGTAAGAFLVDGPVMAHPHRLHSLGIVVAADGLASDRPVAAAHKLATHCS